MSVTKSEFDRWDKYVTAVLVTASMNKGRELEAMVRAVGLCGEAAELTEALEVWEAAEKPTSGHLHEAVIKELGDFLWYAGALHAWGCEGTGDFVPPTALLGLQWASQALPYKDTDLCKCAGAVGELMKKHIGHDRPFDRPKFMQLIARCIVSAAIVAQRIGVDLPDVCATNIAKLRARFQGGGFSGQLAAQKLDEKASPA